MNLLGKIWVRLSLVLAISTLFSCVDPVDVGVQLDPDGIKLEVLFEEILLPTTNVFIDSIRTNNSLSLLVGKYEDPIFGTTTSTAYTHFTTSQSSPQGFAIRNSDENAYIFDSLILELRINASHLSIPGQNQEIFIHQLEDTLFSSVFYLNDFSTPLSSEPIGQSSFNFIPSQDTLLKFSLNETFGQKFIDVLESTSQNGAINIAAVISELKGIGIRGGDNNTALIGFNPNSNETNLRMYFQIENERDSLFTDFQFSSTSVVRYHNTVTDRSTSLVSGATTNFGDFDVNDGNVYLQPGSGIYPKISLAPLKEFLNSQNDIIINRSEISLGFPPGFEEQEFISVNQNTRYIFVEDNENVNVSGLANLDRVNTLILTNASYLSGIVDQLVSQHDTINNNFVGDMTFFTQILKSGSLDPNNIVLMPLDGTTFNQTVFDKDSVKLKLFYTIPKQ